MAGLADAGAGGDAKLKSPKSLEALAVRLVWGNCRDFDAIAGFAASFGPTSKKPPPLRDGDVTCGAATDDRCVAALLKLAKGSDLGCCWGFGAGVDAGGLKFNPPKASSRPPKLDCCWAVGDCIPPNDGCLWGCGGG